MSTTSTTNPTVTAKIIATYRQGIEEISAAATRISETTSDRFCSECLEPCASYKVKDGWLSRCCKAKAMTQDEVLEHCCNLVEQGEEKIRQLTEKAAAEKTPAEAPKKVRATKYDYPEGATKAEKRKFRRKMRRAAKKAAKGEAEAAQE